MKLIYILVLGVVLITSCNKKIELEGGTPDFTVKLQKAIIKVNEEAVFLFEGNAGIVSFFSGEVGSDYNFRKERILTTEDLRMSFTSAISTGGTQVNQLSIMASTDFNGNYSSFANIQSANWQNITSRFTLGTNATFVNSTEKNIYDLIVPGKPLYIAYKYLTKPQATAGVARPWLIRAFALNSTTNQGNVPVADMFNSGFVIVDQNPETAPAASSVNTTTITMLGNEFTAENDPQTENWAVSKAIYAEKIDKGPDRPIPIKGNSDRQLKTFNYVYKTKGVFKVYFIGSNINVYDNKTIIRELEVTVED
ncbi:DUF5017 domain-containing protein [Pedobacter nyackensis]|uniref:DUF5017 domain-containing protein n=1 Tax=Pedobacter nyackensis TaxID=475255 RepID=A0A1W2EX27_9SPHI|nr:DUF5017 domain-containing protein [Pedobacter nyackensis]SMD14263.1 protein of unknown function [Pedobacter nyackensis]